MAIPKELVEDRIGDDACAPYVGVRARVPPERDGVALRNRINRRIDAGQVIASSERDRRNDQNEKQPPHYERFFARAASSLNDCPTRSTWRRSPSSRSSCFSPRGCRFPPTIQ